MATKTLEQLLKLSTHKVEQKQQDIAKLMAAQQALENDQRTAREQLMKVVQEAAAHDDLNMLQQAGNYSDRVRDEIQQMQKGLGLLAEQLTLARNQLREHFAEQKRYEILLEQKRTEAARALNKKQQNELDEIAATR